MYLNCVFFMQLSILKSIFRLSYAKWLLLEMVQNYPTQKLNIMYDIACKLHKNLEQLCNYMEVHVTIYYGI